MLRLLFLLTVMATTIPARADELPSGLSKIPVIVSGGHDTDPVDRGRPVILVASALGVSAEVFREAFSGVQPARNGPPTAERAQQNKAVLMEALGKYGVTNDRLDEVSNYYRYRPQAGELWKHREATAVAVVKDGVIVRYEITDPGAGYSTPPVITIKDIKGTAPVVKLFFGKDLTTNGSIASIEPAKP